MKPGPRFRLLIALAATAAALAPGRAVPAGAARIALPPPVVQPRSTEICLNSRVSSHGGWSGTATQQMLGDVVHAASRAPVTGAFRDIYVALRDAVYRYDPVEHALALHKSGDWRSDPTAAFELGIAASSIVDAGAAMHLAQLESVALWTGTAGQLAACPRASATTFANAHWDVPDSIDIAISFGIRSVTGFTTTLVAISSDGSLPEPRTDGTARMDSVLLDLPSMPVFAGTELGAAEISQILWATYGCSNHRISAKAGLVCSSAVANYYLTRRIYAVGPAGVHRYHNRLPPGDDLTTRDHRIELLTGGDARPALRAAVATLPTAPEYLVICTGAAGSWPEVEVGFAAMGAILQSSSLGLAAGVNTGLSPAEQVAVRTATGIPAGDMPMAVVSLGAPATGTTVPVGESIPSGGPAGDIPLTVTSGIPAAETMTLAYTVTARAVVHLAIYDCRGRRVRDLVAADEAAGDHTVAWNGRDDRGEPVLAGTYFARLSAGGLNGGARIVIVR